MPTSTSQSGTILGQDKSTKALLSFPRRFGHSSSAISSVLVTSASRELELYLVHLLAERPDTKIGIIFAAIRSTPSSTLKELITRSESRIMPLAMAINDPNNIKNAINQVEKTVGAKGLNVLINNARVLSFVMGGIERMDDLSYHLNVNVVGVHNTTLAFLPLLHKRSIKKILNMSVARLQNKRRNSIKINPVQNVELLSRTQ